eukprot:TRINITY_DN1883_c0_g1_i2.p1 TRINITY_DN1883_c0_g1~~TRINITY_DN1883_c0_g1_i2.p1  ORF type:complete len:164 (-),score=25.05 TRINITY_DN1883_c0_g1_i2:22-513(-)
MALLQFRAPVVKGANKLFAGELFQWIDEAGFLSVMFLSSGSGIAQLDDDIVSSEVKYFSSDNNDRAIEIGIKPLDPQLIEEIMQPGTFFDAFYDKLCFERFSVIVLNIFCNEGFTVPQAYQLTHVIFVYLGYELNISEVWKEPHSWKLLTGPAMSPEDALIFF